VQVPGASSPKIRALAKEADSALTFGSLAGRDYRLEYKTDLDQSDWTDLGISIAATNNPSTLIDQMPLIQRDFIEC
jgi:hypothetical protein